MGTDFGDFGNDPFLMELMAAVVNTPVYLIKSATMMLLTTWAALLAVAATTATRLTTPTAKASTTASPAMRATNSWTVHPLTFLPSPKAAVSLLQPT